MINQNWIILGIAIQFLGGLRYLIDTFKGNAKPNSVSFFMWSLASFIAFLAEVKQGVGLPSLMTFFVSFIPFTILIASFVNKKAYWKLGPFDFICGALSLLGLIFWGITKIGNVAIAFSIASDGLASLPTIVKSYYHPETESSFAYLASSILAIITILTITNWNFATYAFPIYILIANLLIYVLVKFKVGRVGGKNYNAA